MCEDGVQRDKTALKEHVEYHACLKQKEKEDHLRKQNESMRHWPISEYQALRKHMVYYEPRMPKMKFFWTKYQMCIFKEVYLALSKKVCPMKPLSIEGMSSDPYYHEMLWVTKKLGLHHLMELQ